MEMQKCPRCCKTKQIDEFHRSSYRPSGRSFYCRSCTAEKSREWRIRNAAKNRARIMKWKKENPGKWDRIQRRAHYKKMYGISLEAYSLMFDEQEGRCAICGSTRPGMSPKTGRPESFSVDHDHKTGRIRALLCRKCNDLLGKIEAKRPYVILAALAYLKRHGSWAKR